MNNYTRILSAVKDQVIGITALSAVGCQIRKRLFHSGEHGDSLPFVCITPLTERFSSEYFGNGACVDYPVLIALFQDKGATVQSESELLWQLDRREELRRLLFVPSLTGVASVFNVEYDPEPAFDLAGLDNHFDLSVQLFTFKNNELRS